MNASHAPPSWPLYALIAAGATALALLTTAQAGIALAHEGQTVPWVGLLKARLVDWYACALFMPLLLFLARRYPLRREAWANHLPILLLASVPIAIGKEAIFVAVGDIFRPGVFHLGTILSEDLSYEVMAVWAFMAVAQLIVGLRDERVVEEPAVDGPPRAASELLVPTRDGPRALPLADIEYVNAQGNYACLVTANRSYLLRETMSHLEARLGDEFLRVHRGLIVRRDRMRRASPAPSGGYWLEMDSGTRLRTGRSYKEVIRAAGIPGA
jgi:hypothetical protein